MYWLLAANESASVRTFTVFVNSNLMTKTVSYIFCPKVRLLFQVREMLAARDSNGHRLLQLITEQLLNETRFTSAVQNMPQSRIRHLWHNIGQSSA